MFYKSDDTFYYKTFCVRKFRDKQFARVYPYYVIELFLHSTQKSQTAYNINFFRFIGEITVNHDAGKQDGESFKRPARYFGIVLADKNV